VGTHHSRPHEFPVKNEPYILAIHDHELTYRGSEHALLADALRNAGYDVGLMLWTCDADRLSTQSINHCWHDAMKRAGITRIDTAHDANKMRRWYKVYPRPEECRVEKSAGRTEKRT
jgi:hypothetical protein